MHLCCGTESRFSESCLLAGEWGVYGTVFKHHFARQAAAALLKFAKATSDPQVAAALVEKAADLKDRLDGLPPPLSDVLGSHETPTQNNDPR